MALPVSFGQITVNGKYVTFAGDPASGTVTFTPSSAAWLTVQDVDTVVVPGSRSANVINGSFSIVVPLTNDPDVVPSFQYTVTENIAGATRIRPVEIPVSLLPGPVDLSEIAVTDVAPATGTTALTRAVADSLYAPIGSTGGGTASVTDATTGSKGIVRLAGDLGGTAAAPTVPGLATKVNSSTYTAGLATKLDASTYAAGIASKLDTSAVDSTVANAVTSTGTQTHAAVTALVGNQLVTQDEGDPHRFYIGADNANVNPGTGGQITSSRHPGHPFWNTPLAANAPLHAESADTVARLVQQANLTKDSSPIVGYYGPLSNKVVQTGDYSRCVYQMPSNWPRVPVYSRANKVGLRAIFDAGVPVPNPADMPDGLVAPAGTDGAVIIIQGFELWEAWRLGPAVPGTDPSNYAWKMDQGGYIADIRTHPAWWSGSAGFGSHPPRITGYNWGVSASGKSDLGGILKAEDWYSPAILHPISMSLPVTGSKNGTGPNLLLPATRYDAKSGGVATSSKSLAPTIAIPEGTRLRLPTSFDIPSYVAAHALPANDSTKGSDAATLTKILTCIRDYGILVGESSAVLAFIAEANKVYGTPYHPYSIAQRPTWGNFAQQIPYGSLVQLAEPTVDISSPNGSTPA